MPQILVVGATLKCPHGGVLRLLAGNPLLTVGGNAAITAGMEIGLVFALGAPGVISPCTEANASGPTPCAISAPATTGTSTLLKIGALPVLLSTAQGLAINATAGPSPWSVIAAGETLADVSS